MPRLGRGVKRKTSGSGGTYVATVHRLDQPVEGVLILAKNKKAASDIAAEARYLMEQKANA